MRALTSRSIQKRGCSFCLDFRMVKLSPKDTSRTKCCIHDTCPYHELDDVKDYSEYLAKTNHNDPLSIYLKKNFNL